MRRYALILIASVLSLSLVADGSFAQRGGRGGGGGGGRAGGGAAPSANRSPSMSRPSTPSASRPSAGKLPSTGPAPSAPGRPSAGKPSTRPSTPGRPSAAQRPSTATRPSTPSAGTRPSIDRDKIQNGIGAGAGQKPAMPDWFQPGSSQTPSTRPAPPTASQLPARPGGEGAGRPGAKPPGAKPPGAKPPGAKPPVVTQPIAPQRPGTKPPIAGRPPGARPPGVRPPARPPAYRPPAGYPPRPWFPGHPSHPSYRPGHWWHWATAATVTGWVIHRWANPIYYRYGTGGTVYYENNVVYVNGQQYGSAEKYYNDTTRIATSVPQMTDEQAAQMEWMPLGVFAITAEGVNASSMYLQLAVSKEGVIAGTFYNESTGVTHPVEGMVDEKTQRAAWKAADGSNANLVMETGLYNLTQDQAEVLVHYGPEQTQTALLVRLDESERPEEEAAPTSQGGVDRNLPGVQVQVDRAGVQVHALGVNVDTGEGGTRLTAPGGALQ